MNIWTISTCTFGKMRVFNVNSRSVNHAARNCGSVKKFGRASGFLAGPVDFQIHWPCGPVVSTVQCQGLHIYHCQGQGRLHIYQGQSGIDYSDTMHYRSGGEAVLFTYYYLSTHFSQSAHYSYFSSPYIYHLFFTSKSGLSTQVQGAKYTPARGIMPCCRCHLP